MKRNREVKVRLSEDELEVLNTDTARCGWSREKYLRALITGRPIKAKPAMDLISVLRNLQQINNNMNQIAMKANSMNFVDTAAYWANIDILKQTIQELLEVMYG